MDKDVDADAEFDTLDDGEAGGMVCIGLGMPNMAAVGNASARTLFITDSGGSVLLPALVLV
jgi:hypothetical protein